MGAVAPALPEVSGQLINNLRFAIGIFQKKIFPKVFILKCFSSRKDVGLVVVQPTDSKR